MVRLPKCVSVTLQDLGRKPSLEFSFYQQELPFKNLGKHVCLNGSWNSSSGWRIRGKQTDIVEMDMQTLGQLLGRTGQVGEEHTGELKRHGWHETETVDSWFLACNNFQIQHLGWVFRHLATIILFHLSIWHKERAFFFSSWFSLLCHSPFAVSCFLNFIHFHLSHWPFIMILKFCPSAALELPTSQDRNKCLKQIR